MSSPTRWTSEPERAPRAPSKMHRCWSRYHLAGPGLSLHMKARLRARLQTPPTAAARRLRGNTRLPRRLRDGLSRAGRIRAGRLNPQNTGRESDLTVTQAPPKKTPSTASTSFLLAQLLRFISFSRRRLGASVQKHSPDHRSAARSFHVLPSGLIWAPLTRQRR